MTDLDAIKGRVRNAYLLDRDDGDALESAMGDVKTLVAEVERLRTHRELCTANLLKGYETGKAEERAAVVAYLLAGTADCRDCMDAAVVRLAREIERGDHRREEDK